MSPDIDKTYIVRSEDTLESIAVQFYGDKARWRTIAEANAIEDPTSIVAGQQLIIPRRS